MEKDEFILTFTTTNDEAIYIVGFYEALLGVAKRKTSKIAVYDADVTIDLLIRDFGFDKESATEYFNKYMINLAKRYSEEMPTFVYKAKNISANYPKTYNFH